MRGHILAVFGALLLACAVPPALQAQYAPNGSYQQTCRDIRSNGDRLVANCQRVDGGWNDTSLDYRNCRGDRLMATCERVDGGWKNTRLKHFDRCQSMIVNDNGNLRCQR